MNAKNRMPKLKQAGFTLIEGTLAIALVIAIGFLIVSAVKAKSAKNASSPASPVAVATVTPTPSPSATAGWVTYTSAQEKSSFEYPPAWTKTAAVFGSNEQAADSVTITSPDGVIALTWISSIDGLGGGCDTDVSVEAGGCPLVTVVSKSNLTNVPGLYVVTGTITKDNKNFEPWIAIQDNTGTTATTRTMGYNLFSSKFVSSGTSIFGSSAPYFKGPNLSQADAVAWLSKPSVVMAKQILNTYTY